MSCHQKPHDKALAGRSAEERDNAYLAGKRRALIDVIQRSSDELANFYPIAEAQKLIVERAEALNKLAELLNAYGCEDVFVDESMHLADAIDVCVKTIHESIVKSVIASAKEPVS